MLVIKTFSCVASSEGISNNIKQKTKKDTRLKMENLIKADLTVKQKNHDIEAIVTFTNTGNKIAYIWEENAPMNRQPTKSLFEISCDEKKIDYKGILVKRKAPTADNFIKITPKYFYSMNMQLDKYYLFSGNNGICKIKYKAYNFVFNSDELFLIESNTVTIKIEQ